MRILYSHRTRSTDGQYVHIDALTRALTAQGHDVIMCGPEGTGRPEELARTLSAGDARPGAKPVSTRIPFGLYEIAEIVYSLAAYRHLAKTAAEFRPDILYERYNLYHHAGAWVAKRFKIPRLLEVNAPLVDERLKNGELKLEWLGGSSERQLWRSADVVLPVTAVLGGIIAEKNIHPSKIRVIPNGVDNHTLVPADGAWVRNRYNLSDTCVLGFVGFVREWHGVGRALNWMATPEGNNTTLLLVGDGPATRGLQEQAAKLGLAERFIVTGTVQREDVAKHVAGFDIALQPAVTPYASPLKLQEYMAQARAIIAPDQANIRETVTDGHDALLINPTDPGSLAVALTRLKQNPDMRKTLGDNARATILSRDMTWAANAKKVISIAEDILEVRDAARRIDN